MREADTQVYTYTKFGAFRPGIAHSNEQAPRELHPRARDLRPPSGLVFGLPAERGGQGGRPVAKGHGESWASEGGSLRAWPVPRRHWETRPCRPGALHRQTLNTTERKPLASAAPTAAAPVRLAAVDGAPA